MDEILQQLKFLVQTGRLIVGTDTAAQIGPAEYSVYNVSIASLPEFLSDAAEKQWAPYYIEQVDTVLTKTMLGVVSQQVFLVFLQRFTHRPCKECG